MIFLNIKLWFIVIRYWWPHHDVTNFVSSTRYVLSTCQVSSSCDVWFASMCFFVDNLSGDEEVEEKEKKLEIGVCIDKH